MLFVLTSLMLCYYNYKDLIFQRPEQLSDISNNAAPRLECCTNKHKSKAKLYHIVVFSHCQPELITAGNCCGIQNKRTKLIMKWRGILELYAKCIFYDLLY